MKIFKGILIALLAVVIFPLVLAFFLGLQLAFVAGGAWLALTVAGWFGWFAGVGWSTYFAIGVCFWAFLIVFSFPTLGKRHFVNQLYTEHKRERREKRRKILEDTAFEKAFKELIETQWSTSKK